jgi:hypothetical protein
MVPKVSNFSAIYYPDTDRSVPFLPFLVAPLGDLQDTLILGPQSVARIHDQFINSLYAQIGNRNLQSIAARVFVFNSKLCIAILFPTNLIDKAGRPGLTLSMGFFVNDRNYRLRNSILASYLNILFQNFNRLFNLSLPTKGADQLLHYIQAKQGSETHQIFLLNLNAILEALLLASITVGEISESKTSWFKFPNWIFRRNRKLPKAVFYPAGSNQQEILSIFLQELGKCLNRFGRTVVQEMIKDRQHSIDLMPVIEFSEILADASKVRLGKSRGKGYLTIY